jgi:2',3'-cyclic-nucleotide 2'-phosphodiesterase (5'-nucleotidase family)
MRWLTTATLVFASASSAWAKVDSLVSERYLHKRGLDASGNYNITVIHTNDVHAHLDEWRAGRGTDCTEGSECISGYARIKQKIKDLKATVTDPVVLNAGDEFQVGAFHGSGVVCETDLGFGREPSSLRIMVEKRFRIPSTKSATMP